jgi:hypothetical protein
MNGALVAFEVWAEPVLTPMSNQDILGNTLKVIWIAKSNNREDFEVGSYRTAVPTAV